MSVSTAPNGWHRPLSFFRCCAMTSAPSTPVVPARQFDPNLTIFSRVPQDRPETEDTELTEYLRRAIAEVMSVDRKPPRCPHCRGMLTRLVKPARPTEPRIPIFRCADCERNFNRVTGTPLARSHLREIEAFLPLLSRQQTCRVAAQLLAMKPETVAIRVRRFRAWLLQLDPTGHWESKVRLGLVPMPDIACIFCGHHGKVHYRGFHEKPVDSLNRTCWCTACGRYFSALQAADHGTPITAHLTAPPAKPHPFKGKSRGPQTSQRDASIETHTPPRSGGGLIMPAQDHLR
jgi:transposase-like protein